MNRADDRFCGGCAKALRATPPTRQAQQIQATTPIDIRDLISETPA